MVMREIDYIAQAGNSIYYGFDTFNSIILLLLLAKILFGKNKIKYHSIFTRLLVSDILLINIHLIRISKLYLIYKQIDNIIIFAFYAIFGYGVYNIFKFFFNILHIEEINNIKSKILFAFPFIFSIRYIFTDEIRLKASFGLFTFLLIIIMTIYMVFYCSVNKTYSDRLYIAVFPMLPIVFTYLHVQCPAIPISVGITLNALIGYLFSADLLISTDQLTNINNRQNLYNFISHKLKHNNDLHVLIIDADDFKQINDKYGHNEGDVCLVRIANALKLACNGLSKRAFICRYGGDEFMIVTDCSNSELVNLRYSILNELDKLNDISDCKVYVTIGIGTYKFEEPEISISELIERADKDLYDKKKNKK